MVKRTRFPDGDQAVPHAQGTIDLAELKDYGVEVSQLGEYLVVDLALPRQIRDMPVDIDITFPGVVIDAGATTAAREPVTLTEGAEVASATRTRVVAMSHPGPQWWVLGLAAGFGVGVGLTLVLLLALRRRRLRSRAAAVASPPTDRDSTRPPSPARAPGQGEGH